MTAREPITTNLIVGIVLPLYRMDAVDIEALAAQLERQTTIVYRQEIQRNLNLYKCQRLVTGPDAAAQQWIADKTRQDAEGIANTYNTQLEREIQRLYASNKFGNRYHYIRGLDAWASKRNAYKAPSIALNTMTAARQYAAQRFREENNVTGRMVFVGPPPVCKRCLRLKALGPVSVEQARAYGDSQHPNCPHSWEQLIPTAIDCENAWTG